MCGRAGVSWARLVKCVGVLGMMGEVALMCVDVLGILGEVAQVCWRLGYVAQVCGRLGLLGEVAEVCGRLGEALGWDLYVFGAWAGLGGCL